MNPKMTIDPDTFLLRYPYLPFAIEHNLAGHPLFEIERLLELRKEIPQKKIDYFTGKVGVNDDKYKTPPTGLSAEETIAQIQNCESWLVLKNVDVVPEYRELLHETLEPIFPLVEQTTPGMRQLECWIFITSPQSIAPYHLDPEHNILLQIHGKKIVHIWDPKDTSILTDEEVEHFFGSGGTDAKLEFKDEYEKKDNVFVVEPGMGVHIPMLAPHWVKVEDEYSISFSVTFYSGECDRVGRLYRFNSGMRRLGLTPSPLGKSPARDAAKDKIIAAYLKTRKLFGRDHETGRQY
jgi:hypothetical protein